jgi:small redox-active disulfide protein 1
MVVIKLLTSPTCPYCPMAKDVLRRFAEQRKDVLVMEMSVTTDEGMKEALKFGIRSVPAMIINDKRVLIGVPTINDLMRVVEETE